MIIRPYGLYLRGEALMETVRHAQCCVVHVGAYGDTPLRVVMGAVGGCPPHIHKKQKHQYHEKIKKHK